MNNNHHISRDEIFPRVSEHTANEDHLKTCDQCNELVNILNHARKISKDRKPDGERGGHPSTLQLSETITQIYDDSISAQEAANFINHVESCSLCFNYIAMTVEDSLSPVPENLLQEIKVYNDISLAEKVLNRKSVFQKVLEKIKKSAKKLKDDIGSIVIPEPEYRDPLMGTGAMRRRPVLGQAIRIAVPVSLVAMISFIILIHMPTGPTPFTYDHGVPFDYMASSFRSTSATAGENSEFQTFSNQFAAAISDYMLLDYETFVTRTENLQSAARSLEAKPLEKKQLSTLRDYYFYLGVSHFALSRSETRDLTDEQRTAHNINAIKYLKEAQSISKTNSLMKIDRDTYFLGLAYGFGGQKDFGILQFTEIEVESNFFKKSSVLSEKWSSEVQ